MRSSGTSTLADLFCSFGTSNCPASEQVVSVPNHVVTTLGSLRGVTAVTVVHQPTSFRFSGGFGDVTCDQLARTPAIGKCARGAVTASVGYFLSSVLGHNAHAASTVWPGTGLSTAEVARLPVDAIVVATNGSDGAVERARTALELAFPFQGTSGTVDALDPGTARLLSMIQDMTDIIIVASLIIAACSLAVNVAAGLGDRKRPFSLLRLTGVSTGVLHRVVALESALPLFVVAAVAIAVGLASSALYLSSQVGIAFRIPASRSGRPSSSALSVHSRSLRRRSPSSTESPVPKWPETSDRAGQGCRHYPRCRFADHDQVRKMPACGPRRGGAGRARADSRFDATGEDPHSSG